jgi:integrase
VNTPDISKATVRAKLPVRLEPYWKRISKGCYLGFYRGKNNDSWHARYRDAQGVQNRRPLAGATDYDSADRQAREWFASCGRGVVRAGTVRQACEVYCAKIKLEKGEAQARSAEGYLRRRVYSHPIADIALDALLAHDVEAWRDGLLEIEGKAAANRDLKQLKAALNRAYKSQLVLSDQAWRSVGGFPSADNARKEFLSVAQRSNLLKCARALSGALGDLVEACLYTAARPIELLRAVVHDVDLAHRVLTLEGYKGRNGEVRRRTIPLTPVAAAFFARIVEGKAADAPLFLDDDGREWNKYDEMIRRARDAAGLPAEVTLYVVRHSVIASWLANGIDAQTVCKVAGTGAAMLERNYGKLIKSHAAERLAAVSTF